MKIFVLLVALHCALAMNKSWWKHTIIYEIFIWSFKDSDGDGIGDIRGIIMKLDHLDEIGVGTLYISPFFKSPMVDAGYDISNFTEIDPIFGTMKDFEELVCEVNRRGMKLVIDFVINHSSDEHEWFQKSIDRIPPYSDYYVWKDAKNHNADGSPNPPNNWVNHFSGSAWTWNSKRKQFYFHQFGKGQPDFNFRNNDVINEICKIMEFWLEKGVAGMRLDAPSQYVEDEQFRDEPLKDESKVGSILYKDYIHLYTKDLRETREVIHQLRTYLDEYSRKRNDFERIFVAEVYNIGEVNKTMLYYGTKNFSVTHFPFNFNLFAIYDFVNARFFNDIMHMWLDNMPAGGVANWNVENHDSPRVIARLNNAEYFAIMLITVMTAPGVAYIYYGQEIGMSDYKIRKDQIQDKSFFALRSFSRDGARTPMQWDDSINAGFSNKLKPWLPVNSNYPLVNVKRQKEQKDSYYNLFKTLSELRKTSTLKYGAFNSYILSPWVFAYTRTRKGHKTYVVVHNLGSETESIDLHQNIKNLSRTLLVVASSSNSGYEKGVRLMSSPRFPNMIPIRPLSSMVLQTM